MKLNSAFPTVLLGLTLCFSLAAAAQKVIDFNGLPKTGVLLPIPNGYAGMNWGNFDYITQKLKGDVRNVAVPSLTSTAQTMSSADPHQPYQLLGMAVVGSWNTTLTLYAYNHGSFVGSKSYPLAPLLPPIRIPPEWGEITQVTFVCRDSQQRVAIYNLWSLTLQGGPPGD
jgi:hypothetical protein